MDPRRIGVECLADVEERRALLIFDVYGIDAGHGGVNILGGHQRDGLALVTHLVLGQEWFVGGNAQRLQVAVLEKGHILPGDDCPHARHGLCPGGVHPGDGGMVMGRAQHLGPEHAGHADIVHEPGTAGHMTHGVVTGESGSHSFHTAPPVLTTTVPLSTAVVLRSNSELFTAAATASRIFW